MDASGLRVLRQTRIPIRFERGRAFFPSEVHPFTPSKPYPFVSSEVEKRRTGP